MNRTQILEAVEALRQRKCRPEREAIAHHILKKHGTQFQDIFNDLETIVDEGGLVKVEYKGSISYRSPNAFAADTSPLLTKHAKVLNSNRTTRFILSAVTELLAEDDSYTKLGIPREAIISKLIEYDSQRFNKLNTADLLQREVTAGTLVPTTEDSLLPKDLHHNFEPVSTNTPKPKPFSPKNMRGRKPAAGSKAAEASSSPSTSGTALTESSTEVFAVKSLPVPVSPSSSKPLRSYGRKGSAASSEKADKDNTEEPASKKSAADKKMPTLSNSAEESPDESKNGDKMPSLVTPEEPTGRSVRNKRKKEVFDPSDLPKKRATVPTTPAGTKEKEKSVPVSSKKTTPTPPTAPRTKRPYRKRNKEPEAQEEVSKPEPPATVCGDCNKEKNSEGQAEAFLICSESECTATYHPSCVGYEKEEASILIEKGTWQCFDCKACKLCQAKPVQGPGALICSGCDHAFHMRCLKIRVRPFEDNWRCPECKEQEKVEGKADVKASEEIMEEDEEENVDTTKESEAEKRETEVAEEVKTAEEIKKVEDISVSATVDDDTPTATTVAEVEKAEGQETREQGAEAEKTAKVEEAAEPEPPPPKKPPVKLGRPPTKKRIISLSLEKKSEAKGKEEAAPASSSAGAKDEGKDDDDLDIPLDASKWTPSQVEAYFKKHGLRDEGILFKEQEIDGLALLLMRRQDIVHGMKLLLGPALKVFKLVVALQQSGGKVDSTMIT